MSTRRDAVSRAKFRHNLVRFTGLQNHHRRVSMLFSFRHGALATLALSAGLLTSVATSTLAQEPAPAPAAAAVAPAPDPATVLATVNGQTITEGDLALAASMVEQQYAQFSPEQRRAAAFMAVLEIKLLVAKATADGIDKDADVQKRLAFLHDRLLHGEVIEKEVSAKITPEEVRARYDKQISETPPVNELRARHILLKTEDEAKEVIKQLDGGADFEALASENTLDPSGKTSGGDLGYFLPTQMVPEFSKAASALEIGAYTKEPVKSDFGWHVIKLEDKRVQQPPSFEQVQNNMRELILREKYFALVNEVRAAAKVEFADQGLKATVEAMDAQQQ